MAELTTDRAWQKPWPKGTQVQVATNKLGTRRGIVLGQTEDGLTVLQLDGPPVPDSMAASWAQTPRLAPAETKG